MQLKSHETCPKVSSGNAPREFLSDDLFYLCSRSQLHIIVLFQLVLVNA